MISIKKTLGIAVLGIVLLGNVLDTDSSNPVSAGLNAPSTIKAVNANPQVKNPTNNQVAPTQAPKGLSNDNYYINSRGNEVHSPAYSNDGVPAGASARCRDGTYSFSQSRSGTCSHHGGVASWL